MDRNFEVLKHGHKYVTRGGEVVTVEHRGVDYIGFTYSFRALGTGLYYTECGETIVGAISPSMLDLVYELVDGGEPKDTLSPLSRLSYMTRGRNGSRPKTPSIKNLGEWVRRTKKWFAM